jgi:hypothetical protein
LQQAGYLQTSYHKQSAQQIRLIVYFQST